MNGTIVRCLENLVTEKFGQDKWRSILTQSGYEAETRFSILDEVADEIVLRLMKNISEVLDLSTNEVEEAFADFWVNSYAQKKYYMYFRNASNARDLLKQMDGVHATMTEYMANAKPPRFEIEEISQNTIAMKYKSERKLFGLFRALVVATAAYYKENVTTEWLAEDKLKITFSK